MGNAQSIATMTETLRSIDKCLSVIANAETAVRITTHYREKGLNNCIHCNESTSMHCDECWAPICYDCAKPNRDDEPICRECKTKEVKNRS